MTPVLFKHAAAAFAIAATVTLSTALQAAPEVAKPAMPHKMATDKMALPVKAVVTKDSAAKTEGPYVLTLTNTSTEALKVTVKVDVSVAVHNRPKTRDLGPQEIAPGKDWKVDDLAAEDKVTVKAEGFEALKLTVK